MDDKIKVMVVDDSEASRKTLEEFFSEAGFEVICEESGEGAWMLLETGKQFDLIVLDWHMPNGMSGPALNIKIQRDERFKSIPVVAFSSKVDPNGQTSESQEWIASFADGGSTLKMGGTLPVAKPDGNSEVRRIPPELVLNVAERLERIGKAVPPLFKQAVAALQAKGYTV